MPANCSSSTPIVSLWCPKVQILAPVQDFSPPPSPLTSFYGFLIWNLNFPMILLWAPKSTCKWGKIYRALGTLRYFQELVNRTAKIYETSKTCYCIKRRPPSENGRFWKSKTELWWCVPEPGWPIADCCNCAMGQAGPSQVVACVWRLLPLLLVPAPARASLSRGRI